jgi:hypothetical protein
MNNKQRKLTKHLRTMELEVFSRLNPRNKFKFRKGLFYYRNQVRNTARKLKEYERLE